MSVLAGKDPMEKKEGMDYRFLIAPALWVVLVGILFVVAPTNIVKVGHLFSVAMNFGMTAWVTCIAGTIMFIKLPRTQFANVQGFLFPIYFLFQSICSFIILYSMHSRFGLIGSNYIQTIIVDINFLCSILQTILIEPKTGKTMVKFMAIRKEEGDNSTSKEFKQAKGAFYCWHGISSLVNVASFLLQAVHIYWLSTMI